MTRFIPSFVSAFLMLLATAVPLNAASSNWADLGGGKARLVADFDPETGEINAAVEIKLNRGWATYWRYPGYTGIPPIFDFSASKNVSLGEIKFPTPSLQTSGGSRYAGYKKSVIFSIKGNVSANQLPSLSLDMLIGVCEEICIPAKANLAINQEQFMQSDPVAKRILSIAKLKMPTQMTSAELELEIAEIGGKTLEISLSHPVVDKLPELFVEGPSDWYLSPAKFQEAKDGKLIFHLDLKNVPDGAEVTLDKLSLTFVSGAKGIEIRD
ncbi:MAG: protein-disulfide reductase DsbD family protein [Rhizobiaceae bacterium]|nr:protein-disulfide reductase DsbD family protein [Rhizobiaceae bacterium]